MRAPGLRHHDRTCTRERAGQIGLVQHRHHRAPGGGDGFAVLGLDYLDGDVDDQVDVRVGGACLRCHRHARRAPSTLQARATVRQPTPGRPRTATRSGSAARCAIATTRWSAELVANRASSSTKIWCPCPRISHPIGSFRMVAPSPPRRESAVVRYPPKATVGYQSGPGAATPGADGPPWTNACATRGRATSRHTGGIGPAPQHEHPVAAVGDLQGPTRDLGATLAGAWPPGATSIPARDTGGYPCLVWP